MFDPSPTGEPDFAATMRAIEMREMEPTDCDFRIQQGRDAGKVVDMRLTLARNRFFYEDDGA